MSFWERRRKRKKECLQKQEPQQGSVEQVSLAFEKLSSSAGEMSKALEEAGKRMAVGFASGFSIGENRKLVRYGGPVKPYVEPYADTTWGEYMTGEKPPEQKRTRCAYCGVISEKDYGTCEHCGAPL